MRKKLALLLLLFVTAGLRADEVADPLSGTMITSDKLTFDYDDKFALFEGNVSVDDPQMKLQCGKLIVRFEENGRVSWLEAQGAVTLNQDDKRALADKMTHDVKSGEFVLTGSPKVYRGKDVLRGDTIRYWRGQNRMVCEPRARLTIHMGKESVGDTILKGK